MRYALLALVATILLLIFGPAQTASASPANLDPRPLKGAEIRLFLQQVCRGPQASSQAGYGCQAMTGYPGDQASPSAGNVYHITPTTIIFGHLTNDTSSEAYVTYNADFEPHSNNYGGGVVFQTGPDGWHLIEWLPGITLDDCVQLEPTGRAKLICLFDYENMGESDSTLALVMVPSAYQANGDYSADMTDVMAGQDLSQSGSPNDPCQQIKSPDQGILMSVAGLARAVEPGVAAAATIRMIGATDAARFCARQDLLHAPITTDHLDITWKDGKVGFSPEYKYAPPV